MNNIAEITGNAIELAILTPYPTNIKAALDWMKGKEIDLVEHLNTVNSRQYQETIETVLDTLDQLQHADHERINCVLVMFQRMQQE